MSGTSAVPATGGSISRRTLLAAAAVGGVGLAGGGALLLRDGPAQASPIGPTSPMVAAAEAARARSGRSASLVLRAAPGTVDLAGATARTWLYNDRLPGPELRVGTGDLVSVRLRNDLPASTSIHWHGLALRNDMDGVPAVTQEPVAPGAGFDYMFVAPHPGTYFFHPHVGLQLDMGLYAPLVIEDPQERSSADVEAVLVLDDWLDGVSGTPEKTLAKLQAEGMQMGGMQMGGAAMDMGVTPATPLGSDTGDVAYPLHLVNGKPPADPYVVTARPGQRVRLRLINTGGDTPYRFAVGGHRLTVTHADGFPVVPVEVDTLIIGMGERYDVVVTALDGVFPIVADLEGTRQGGSSRALALLRTASGTAPAVTVSVPELGRRLLSYADLAPAAGTGLPSAPADRQLRADLGLTMPYSWTINGRTGDGALPLAIQPDERAVLTYTNRSSMWHPMHLHGHTFALLPPTGPGTRKDTVIVAPGRTVALEIQADNPGQWMIHCHNAYHLSAGMATRLSYEREH